MIKVFASRLRAGDETVFPFKPGGSTEVKVRVVKAMSLPDNTVEVRWVNSETDETVFEGLYSYYEEVEILYSGS